MAAEPQPIERVETTGRYWLLAAVACALWAAGLLALFAANQAPMGSISGRVAAEDSGRPIAGAELYLAPADSSVPGRRRRLLVDPRGYFQLRRVHAGDYLISARSRAHHLPATRVTIAEGRATDLVLEMAPTDSFLDLSVPQHVFVPGEPVQVTAHGFVREDALLVESYRVDPLRVMREARGYLWRILAPGGDDYGPGPEGHLPLSRIPTLASVGRSSVAPQRDAEGVFTQRLPLPIREPGLYVVACRGDGMERLDWLMVTGLGVVTKRCGTDLLAYAVDLASGKPAPGTEIRLSTEKAEGPAATTDGSGMARLAIAGDGSALLAARRGDSMAFVRLWSGDRETEGAGQQRVFLYTDRPVYRPGDTVRFKGIARVLSGVDLRVPPEAPVRVEVHDSRNTLVYAGDLQSSDFGSFDGAFSISPEASTGAYTLSAEVDGRTHEHAFSVAAYRKPEYSVTVTPEQESYTRGEPGWVSVEARYFFGAPVVGATVQYAVMRSPVWAWQEEDPGFFPFGDDSGEGEVVTYGEARTDARGRCRIRFETAEEESAPASAEDAFDPGDHDYRYSIEATVYDEGRFSATGSSVVKVWRGEFSLDVEPDRFVAGAGDEIAVTATARDHSGKPLGKVRVDLDLVRRDWGDDGFTLVTAGSSRGETGADGTASGRFRAPAAGSYQARARARDSRGNRIQASAYVWVTGGGGITAETRLPDLQVVADRKSYQPGDMATFLVNTAEPGGSALVTVETDRVLDWRVVPLAERSTPVRLRVTREHLPNFTLSVCSVRNKEISRREVEVSVSPRARALQVEVVPDRTVYAPGDEAVNRLRVRDADGRPVRAEVSLGIVDESIYAIQEDHADILAAFFPRRYNPVETDFSFPQIYLSGADKAGAAESVRKEFPDTALWLPAIRTDGAGEARVRLRVPDSLTTWRATARAHTRDTLVGQAVSKVACRKELMVRIQAPRFFTARDAATLSAMVHNESAVPQRVTVSLKAEGLALEGAREPVVRLRPGEAKRLDWRVRAADPGKCRLVASARAASGLVDAVEARLPILPHGRARLETRAGSLSGDGSVEEKLTIRPDAVGSTTVGLQLAPSLASGMLAALGYLASYPYGCTEQTMSCFLPDLVVYRSLSRLGARSPALAKHLSREVPEMVNAGLQRLYRYQHDDGGWGWWEYDESDPGMTAYVVEGLVEARDAGFAVNEKALGKGVEWLLGRERAWIARAEGIRSAAAAELLKTAATAPPDGVAAAVAARTTYRAHSAPPTGARAETLLAMAVAGVDAPLRLALDGRPDAIRRVTDPATLARLCLAAQRAGRHADAAALCDRVCARASEGAALCHWGDDPEITARALQAILAVGLSGEERRRLAAKSVRWLLSRRDGDHWVSTKHTAHVLFALADYLEATGEAAPDFTVVPVVNGKALSPVRFDSGSIFQPEARVEIPAGQIRRGDNRIVLRKSGPGNLYYTIRARQFIGQEDLPVLVAGAGITVERTYHRLRPDRDPEGGALRLLPSPRPVERLEAGESYLGRIVIRTSKAYEHLVIEEPLPAGCEPLDRGRTGPEEWDRWWTDVDVRDDQIAFFARRLNPGRHALEYYFRASVPGKYHVMPTQLTGMYDPDVRAGGAETRVEVR